jgi:hypothetical protein
LTSPKNAWSDENDLRWYTFQDRDYLSVTSLRKVLGMPFNLHNWVLKQTLEAVQRDPSLLVPQDTGKGKRKPIMESPANVRGRIMRAGMAERDRSAERGTEVHAAIANGLPLSYVPAELQPYVEQYANAVIALGLKPLMVERQVFNKTYGYAGSFDLMASMRSKGNRRYIIDLKTGKGTYAEHALQGMSYLDGEFVGEDDRIDKQATDLLHTATDIGILHLRPDGWEFHDIPVTNELRQTQRAMATLAHWFVKHPTIDTLERK